MCFMCVCFQQLLQMQHKQTKCTISSKKHQSLYSLFDHFCSLSGLNPSAFFYQFGCISASFCQRGLFQFSQNIWIQTYTKHPEKKYRQDQLVRYVYRKRRSNTALYAFDQSHGLHHVIRDGPDQFGALAETVFGRMAGWLALVKIAIFFCYFFFFLELNINLWTPPAYLYSWSFSFPYLLLFLNWTPDANFQPSPITHILEQYFPSGKHAESTSPVYFFSDLEVRNIIFSLRNSP